MLSAKQAAGDISVIEAYRTEDGKEMVTNEATACKKCMDTSTENLYVNVKA